MRLTEYVNICISELNQVDNIKINVVKIFDNLVRRDSLGVQQAMLVAKYTDSLTISKDTD